MAQLIQYLPINLKTKLYLQAYILMLHLVSKGADTYKDIIDFLFWNNIDNDRLEKVLEFIDKTISELQKQWNEDIPKLKDFIFEDLTPEQQAEYSSKTKAYDKWDKVLEVFRHIAYEKLYE